jgi:hypothetical protein
MAKRKTASASGPVLDEAEALTAAEIDERTPPEEIYFTDIYGRDDLRVVDLGGQERTVTIKGAAIVEVTKYESTEKQRRIVLYFHEYEKGLLLNKTNGSRIYEMYGNDVAKWCGRKITLYPSETEIGGKTVDCIRVRAQTAKLKR